MKPDISVIIPVYNAAEYIGGCLDSVLCQHGCERMQVIVVDDGSTDNSASIIETYQAHFPNLVMCRQENRGVSFARNRGLGMAHGEYVTFVDADDQVGLKYDSIKHHFDQWTNLSKRIGPMKYSNAYIQKFDTVSYDFDDNYFVNMLDAARRHNADVVMGGKVTINAQEKCIKQYVYTKDLVFGASPMDMQEMLLQANSRESANFALYRRDMLVKNKIHFSTAMSLDEDMLFCMLSLLNAQRTVTLADSTYMYNRHSGTLSNFDNTPAQVKRMRIADIQRFSILLYMLHKNPGWAKIYNYWLKYFARLGADDRDWMEHFPTTMCAYCLSDACQRCNVGKHVEHQLVQNIRKFFGPNIRGR